jgi:hypothetical protein
MMLAPTSAHIDLSRKLLPSQPKLFSSKPTRNPTPMIRRTLIGGEVSCSEFIVLDRNGGTRRARNFWMSKR